MKDYDFSAVNVEKLFGHEAAEREDVERLQQYFIKRSDYEEIKSTLPLKIVVGYKGVGKSALLKVAYQEDMQNNTPALWIRPDDVSELYKDILQETNFLNLVTLWKKGLSRLIACRIAEDWICVVREEAEVAIRWAEQAGYRSRDLISQLAHKFKPLIKKEIDLDSVIEPQIGEHRLLKRLIEDKSIKIYIDDLDRGWHAGPDEKRRLSALINALGDLTTDIKGLKARMSLRTDVYTLIRESDESTDKFSSSIVPCSWTNHDILIALVKRINTFLERDFDEALFKGMRQSEIAEYLSPIFTQRFTGTRCWDGAPAYRVIMSLIRRRPRDMVKLCSSAAKYAYNEGSNIISGNNIVSVLEEYSMERMTDIINEFSGELVNISDLIYNMGPTTQEIKDKKTDRYLYSTAELFQKIKNLNQSITLVFAHNLIPNIHDIAHFLYKIGFITARKNGPDNKIERYYYDEKKQLLRSHVGDQGFSWEIHPAYRGALSRSRRDSWESTLMLLNDED